MQQLQYLSATKLQELISSKQISCVEVMQAHLQQIAQVNPQINALTQHLEPEQALEQARAADKVLAQDNKVGKLHGIPVTIKDGYKVKGFISSKGNQSFMNKIATEDATVAARLRTEGAIIMGVTNIPEFLLAYETDNLLYGRSNNPYDLTRTPGGSSGGEAAIIAAGGSALGVASDAGGSIRQPAHNCGIVGLKPTKGLLPSTGNFPVDGGGLMSLIGTFGPMARYVDDIILALPILAGPDGYDPYTVPMSVRDPAQVDVKSLRVAFYTDDGIAKVNDDTLKTMQRVVEVLKPQVNKIENKLPSGLANSQQLLVDVFFLGGDGGQWLLDLITLMKIEKLSFLCQEFLVAAEQCRFTITELRRKLIAVDQFRIGMTKFMDDFDVIICPVVATPAKVHGHTEKEINDFSYLAPYNLTGWPVASIRCGTSQEGLPIGVQIIAKPWREDIVLAVAKHLERELGGWTAPEFNKNQIMST